MNRLSLFIMMAIAWVVIPYANSTELCIDLTGEYSLTFTACNEISVPEEVLRDLTDEQREIFEESGKAASINFDMSIARKELDRPFPLLISLTARSEGIKSFSYLIENKKDMLAYTLLEDEDEEDASIMIKMLNGYIFSSLITPDLKIDSEANKIITLNFTQSKDMMIAADPINVAKAADGKSLVLARKSSINLKEHMMDEDAEFAAIMPVVKGKFTASLKIDDNSLSLVQVEAESDQKSENANMNLKFLLKRK